MEGEKLGNPDELVDLASNPSRVMELVVVENAVSTNQKLTALSIIIFNSQQNGHLQVVRSEGLVRAQKKALCERPRSGSSFARSNQTGNCGRRPTFRS